MAGDWIKISVDLPDKPEVIAIASIVGIDQDTVAGKLIRFWGWADQHTIDGNAPGVTLFFVDRCTNCEGFGKALVKVGWLIREKHGLRLPKFEAHNGETGKRRALTAKRVGKLRNAKGNAEHVTKSAPRSEIRDRDVSDSDSDHKDSILKRTDGVSPGALAVPETTISDATPLAARLFRQMNYHGRDGAIVWRAAILVVLGNIPEVWAVSAAEGAKLNAKRNSLGFFRETLANSCRDAKRSLDELLVTVRLPQGFNCGPPLGPRHIRDVLQEVTK